MELFTNSHPSLITNEVTSKIDTIITDISKGGSSIFRTMYDKIIYPNLTLIILIIILIIFLIYCYYSEKNMANEPNKNIKNEQYENVNRRDRADTLFDGKYNQSEQFIRPVFNPTKSINEQESYVQYLPDDLPINIDDQIVRVHDDRQYSPPPNDYRNPIEYKGPQYAYGKMGVSDESNRKFVGAAEQNLFEFDDLLGDKIELAGN